MKRVRISDMPDLLRRSLALALRALPALLFSLAALAFEEPHLAVPLLSATLLHECGHLLAFSLVREPPPRFRAAEGGFRLVSRRPLSPFREAVIAGAGPLANLLSAALLSHSSHPYFAEAAMLHRLTALWNLLPIAELDGARLLASLLSPLPSGAARGIGETVSVLALSLLLFTSLFVLYFSGAAFYTSLACLSLLLTFS